MQMLDFWDCKGIGFLRRNMGSFEIWICVGLAFALLFLVKYTSEARSALEHSHVRF